LSTFDWNAVDAADAGMMRADVQFAINIARQPIPKLPDTPKPIPIRFSKRSRILSLSNTTVKTSGISRNRGHGSIGHGLDFCP
jgi:hypothetical protein